MVIFKKATLALLAGILCLFFLSSCSFSGAGSENLLHPSQSAKEKSVYEFLSVYTQDNYSLVYASRGSYQNPLLFKDIDGDGTDEVIVNYVPLISTEKRLVTLILRPTDRSYSVLGRISGLSDQLDKIEFGDLTGDGIDEIIIGYGSLGEYYASRLNIAYYDAVSETFVSGSNMWTYSDFLCIDFNRDGRFEVMNIDYSSLSAAQSTAFCIVHEEGVGFYTLTGGAFLSTSAQRYRIFTGSTADGFPAIYVTSKVGNMLKGTEIITWISGSPVPRNISLGASYSINDSFVYYGDASAQDIDSDGVYEYPVSDMIDESQITQDINDSLNFQNMEILCYPCSWYYIEENFPVYDFTCYMNTEHNYYITIKNPSYYTDVKVYIDSAGNLLFYGSDKELLFSITASSFAPADKSTELLYISETGTYLSYIINPEISTEARAKLIPKDELLQSITVTGIITAS